MLVLARRLHEKIVFPTLDTTIQVVGLQGNLVRLGIDAPRDVPVFREEVYDPALAPAPAEEAAPQRAVLEHNVCNRLNNLGLCFALLQRQLPANLSQDAQKTLEQLHAHYTALKDQVQALLEGKAPCGRQPQLTA
jgi:carbon storage regulator